MKLCAPCLRALGGREGVVCLACRRKLKALLTKETRPEQPPYWVPEAGEGTLVVGLSGMGKSTYEKGWTGYCMGEGVPVYWWDPMREASVHGIQRKHAALGPLLTQVTVADLVETPKEWLSLREEGAMAPALALVPTEERPTRAQRAKDFVEAMNLFIRFRPQDDCVLVLAECGLLEGEAEAEEMLGEILTTWRKEGVSPVIDAQGAYQVPVRARDQVRVVVAFKQIGSNDLRAVKALAGKRFADTVEGLEPHACVLADRMDLSAWKGAERGADGSDAGDEAAA